MTPTVRRIANRLTAERNDRVRHMVTPVRLADVWTGRLTGPRRKAKDGEEHDPEQEFLDSLRAAFQRRWQGMKGYRA